MQATKLNSEFLFSAQQMEELLDQRFLQTKLGQLYLTIPFQELASCFPARKHTCGTRPIFTIEGGIALMFLKSYLKLSDEKLIEQLNCGNWAMQRFCNLRLGLGEQIKDFKIVSRWRVYIGQYLSEEKLQKCFVQAWKGDIEDQGSNLSDATCYESYVRFPTDTKLLWESIYWLRQQMLSLCNYVKTAHPRNKYHDVKKAYQSYSRQRRKSRKSTRKIKRRLLHLLHKMLGQISPLIGYWKTQAPQLELQSPVKANFFVRLKTIKKVYRQQQLHFDRPDVPIPNRIVSLAKPYLRPIVRGKENKRVEFGKKVHKMMVGGIGWIEHASFDAFHEGNRMKRTIWKHRSYFGRCSHFSGDQIYANNKNRKYCSKNGIFHSFRPKGRAAKDEKQKRILRNALNKERATVLEGSFGNDKNHYNLHKIKARTEATENVWIFFGIMCANAMKIAKKRRHPT